ncbi:MAG: hypothetical protein AAB738_00950 [Patescibacteria group bacterium]
MNLFNFEFNFTGLNIRNIFRRKQKLGKNNAYILFIDDETFPVVENLVKAGWSARRIKDIKNIQDEEVSRAHVIFVDYKGVGRNISEQDQGIGVIKAIKAAYGDSKRVVLYSGYARFDLSMDMRKADNQLPKNSDTYEFISMIESELKKIK